MWERKEGIKGEGREEGVQVLLPTVTQIQMVPNLGWFNLRLFNFTDCAKAIRKINDIRYDYKIGLVLDDFAQL